MAVEEDDTSILPTDRPYNAELPSGDPAGILVEAPTEPVPGEDDPKLIRRRSESETDPALEYGQDEWADVPGIVRDDPRSVGQLRGESRALLPGEEEEPSPPRDRPPEISRALGEFDVVSEFRRSQARMEQMRQERREEMEPLYEDYRQTAARPLPEPPQFRQPPPPPNRQFGQQMQDSLGAAMMAAVFGALISRQRITGGLNSFSGFMDGVRQGNLDQAKIALEDWRAASADAVQYNNTMLKQYEAILKNQHMNEQQKFNAIRLAATKWRDEMRIQAAENRNMTELARSIEATRYHTAQLAARNRGLDIQEKRLNAIKEAKDPTSPMSESAKKVIAEMFLETGKLPPNIWRGKTGAADARAVMELVADMADAQGLTGADLAARLQSFAAQTSYLTGAARTAGALGTRVGSAVAETETTIPLARVAMKHLAKSIGLGNYPAVNHGLMLKAHATGSEELRRARQANEAVITAYGAVMGRGTPQLTNLARTRADSLLQLEEGPKVYNAGLEQMKAEMNAAKDAPEEAVRRILSSGTGRTKAPRGPPKEDDDKDPFNLDERLEKLKK